MLFSLWAPAARRSPYAPSPSSPLGPRFRPQLDGFEDRVVPAAPALAAAQAAPITVAPTFNLSGIQLNVQDINVLSNNNVNTLAAVFQNGTAAVPIDLGATPNPADAECPILNLHLGPISLDLLGLNVDTSEICLDIVADPEGGVLGELLCGVANLLNDGVPLSDILGGLVDGVDVGALTDALQGILNDALGQLTNTAATVGGIGGLLAGRTTDILNLSVGPLELNVLGLEVFLDDCNGGPVTIDITAESGPGNLLGNLLGGLGRLLDTPANVNAIANKLDKIANTIGKLV